MEYVKRADSFLTKASSDHRVINVFLAGSFVVLYLKSRKQGKNIEALQAEKESLTESNRTMKKTMWEWKQQLFADAATKSAIPLARIKAIYGDRPTPPIGDAVKESVVKKEAKSTSTKIIV